MFYDQQSLRDLRIMGQWNSCCVCWPVLEEAQTRLLDRSQAAGASMGRGRRGPLAELPQLPFQRVQVRLEGDPVVLGPSECARQAGGGNRHPQNAQRTKGRVGRSTVTDLPNDGHSVSESR